MKANPDKFQVIAIGPKTNRHNLSFDLKGNTITCEANVKLLNRLGRLTIYYSFILSNFNYCPVTWHFCSEKNTKKLKKFRKELSVSFMKTMKILMKIYLKNLNCHL
jgi:hypothetical protein